MQCPRCQTGVNEEATYQDNGSTNVVTDTMRENTTDAHSSISNGVSGAVNNVWSGGFNAEETDVGPEKVSGTVYLTVPDTFSLPHTFTQEGE